MQTTNARHCRWTKLPCLRINRHGKYIHSLESAILRRPYWQSVLSGYVTICQGLPYFVRVCNNLSGWALFCQGVPYFVRVCYILSWYAIFCEGPLNFVRVHETRHLWGSENTLWGFYCLWGCTLTNTFWTLTKYWYHNSTHTNINPPDSTVKITHGSNSSSNPTKREFLQKCSTVILTQL